MSDVPTPPITTPSQVIMDPASSPHLGDKREEDSDETHERCSKKIKTSHTLSESPEPLLNSTRLATPHSSVAPVTVEDKFPSMITSASQSTKEIVVPDSRRSGRTKKNIDYAEIMHIDSSNSSDNSDSPTNESMIEAPPTKRNANAKSKASKSSKPTKTPAGKTRAKRAKKISKIMPKPHRQTRSKTASERTSLIVVLNIDEHALERTLNRKQQPVVAQAAESFMRDSAEDHIDHEMVNAAMALLQLSGQGPPSVPPESVLAEYFREDRLRKQDLSLEYRRAGRAHLNSVDSTITWA
ncbi:hypothetical protein BDU57DRAFT_536821 [Ampelomyces quisqualis]|uniref:Uncharacterized protein n=1 Tax=Ampelomyces quisqualis TaxID=50730 RepID=A0A6A5QWT2_AMPQU|nr:hypothetical protein BDU57DRAFT_536821 [Ampelomyces quisqualis]